MIDTHCHLDSARFDADRDDVLARAWAAGLNGLVIPAIGPSRWEALLDWPRRDKRVQVALGIHPQLLPELDPAQDAAHLETLDRLLGQGGAVAVGECGLDGPSVEGAPLARQREVLERHFALADQHRLPVLVHCLRAHPTLRELLRARPIPKAGLLLHSYSGSAEQVKFYADKGCHFSLAGPVTFPEARRPLEAVRAIPRDRLMLETDAPDQAPHPHRGGRCEPGYLPRVLDAVAAALGESPPTVAERTSETARRFFGTAFLR